MSDATADITKRKRPEQAGTPVMVRLQPADLAALDAWIAAQGDQPSRPEAVRALIRKAMDL